MRSLAQPPGNPLAPCEKRAGLSKTGDYRKLEVQTGARLAVRYGLLYNQPSLKPTLENRRNHMQDPSGRAAECCFIASWISQLTELLKSSKLQLVGRIAAVVCSIGITVGIILLRDHIREFAVYGYPGIFLVTLIGNATVILPAPTYAIVFAVGGVLDPYLVGVVAGLGAALGEMTGYLAGMGGRGVIENRAIYNRFEYWMRKAGWLVIFLLAALPNPFFDVGGMVAGALRMPLYRFLIACWAGKTVRFIALGLTGGLIFGH